MEGERDALLREKAVLEGELALTLTITVALVVPRILLCILLQATVHDTMVHCAYALMQ